MSTVFEIENGILKACQTDETEITIPDDVRVIGENVFKGMRKLIKAALPNSVEIIGSGAFKGCTMLSVINFPDALREVGGYAFHRCHSLENAILPDSVEKIGCCAFLYCDGMKKISIGGVKRLERQTFANCTELRELRLNAALETDNLGDDIFTGCVGIRKISFTDGRSIELENLAAAVGGDTDKTAQAVARSVYNSMKLENGVLYRLSVNLKSFEVPEGVTVIEKSCFYDKKGITRITLPKTLRAVKANAFANCINLEEIVFRNSGVEIDNKAFKGCNNLERVILENGVYYPKSCLSDGSLPAIARKIGEQLLSDFYISGKNLMAYRGKEERVCVPDGITVIGEGCFENNSAIGRVILPDSIREIRENAFKGCVSMQTIRLSQNLETIEKGAFENCKKLLKIELHESVRRIGESAFKRCLKLNSFAVNDALEEIGDMAFYGCKELKSFALPRKAVLNGRLVFFNSGLPSAPESSGEPSRVYPANSVAPYRFCKNKTVVSVKITEPIVIGKYAYSGCPELIEIVIDNPECVIEEHAFEKCPRLKKVKLNAKSIEKGAFSFCRSLETVMINGTEIIGEQAFFGCEGLREIKLSDAVTELGARCFEECASLEKIRLYGIKTIGERAFSRCEGLREITLGKITVYRRAFEDCCFIEKLTLLSDTALKSGAFFGCTYLKEIELDGIAYFPERFSQSIRSFENPLPERVQEIIASAYSCFDVSEDMTLIKYTGNASRVKIPRDITALGDEAFRNRIRTVQIDIPESVGNVGKLTFAGSGWLDKTRAENKITVVNNMVIDALNCGESAVIPAVIKRVCSWSFAGNTELREVKFLGGRTIVDEYAFRNCVGLKRVIDENGRVFELRDMSSKDDPTLPEYIRKIFAESINCFKTDENGTLYESTGNIKSLVFVSGIKAIGGGVFKDCNLLREITLCGDTEIIGESAFENGKQLKSVKNATGVKRIEAFAFRGCQELEEIELSDELSFIGKRAFEHCCKLKSVTIPEGVRVIRERTFFRCKSLKKIVLPSTIEVIEEEAFAFCTELEEAALPKGLKTLGERAFAHCPKLKAASGFAKENK